MMPSRLAIHTLAATSLATAFPAALRAEAVTWDDLNQARLPKTLSCHEIATLRYRHLGFSDARIGEIFAAKAALRAKLSDWPRIADEKKAHAISLQTLPEGMLGKHNWPADDIAVARDLAKAEREKLGQILSEELLHATQETSAHILDQVFIGPADEPHLPNRIAQYRTRIQDADRELDRLAPGLSALPFKELTNRSLELLARRSATQAKVSSLISDFIIQSDRNIPLEKMPVLGIEDQLQFIREYAPPQSLIDAVQALAREHASNEAIRTALASKSATIADAHRFLISNYYRQVKIEIDPRLSDAGFAWMQAQKNAGGKVEPILTELDGERALGWFLEQKFEEGSVFDIHQRGLRSLLNAFPPTERKKVLQQLIQRMPTLAAKMTARSSSQIAT